MKISTIRSRLFQGKRRDFSRSNLLELVLLTAVVPVVGYLYSPRDPFLLNAGFPILLVPPFLLALRYGLTVGMVNFAVIAGCVTGAYFYGIGEFRHYPAQLLFGILVMTLVAGEMTDALRARLRQIQAQNQFTNMRFSEFTNAFHVMKVSHDQLKEQLANDKFSLREALQTVREQLQEQYRKGNRGLSSEVGGELLSVLNHFCSTQIAGVCMAAKSGGIDPMPVAVQGNLGKLKSDDPLVGRTLKEGTMVSVVPEKYTYKSQEELETGLLAVVPIKDISGYLWGVIVVEEMHFTAFQKENLNLMQLIGAYSGDLLSRAENIFYSRDDRQAFLYEMEYSWQMASKFNIISSLIAITFETEAENETKREDETTAADLFAAISNRIRSIDHAWLSGDGQAGDVIFLMMTLMTKAEFFDFRKSLDLFLEDRIGSTLADLGGVCRHLEITSKRRFRECVAFISDVVP